MMLFSLPSSYARETGKRFLRVLMSFFCLPWKMVVTTWFTSGNGSSM